jgi:putative hemolysin
LFAAIFAAAEASILSLSRIQLDYLKNKRPSVYTRIRMLIFKPENFLSTLIIGNEFLNILLPTFITTQLEHNFTWKNEKWLIVSSVISSAGLLLLFSEIFPKMLAFKFPINVATLLSYPLSWVHFLLTPLRVIFLVFSNRILRLFGIRPPRPSTIDEKDFLTLVEIAEETGSVDETEKQRIVNVFQFSDTPVSVMMTPWSKVFHLEDTSNRDEVISKIRQQSFSRIPIFSSRDKKVLGILYTKELLKLLVATEGHPHSDWKSAILPPYVVTEHQKASKLLTDFKQKKVHIALVVNEFGKHVGIITLEDILNSLIHQKKIQDKVNA